MGKKYVFISYCEKQLLLLRDIDRSNSDKKVKSEMIIVHNNIEKEIDLYNQYLTMKKDIVYDVKKTEQQALVRKNAIKLLKTVRKLVKQCSSKAYDRYCANFDFPILASSLKKIYNINMSLEQYLNYEIKLCKKRNSLDLHDIKDYQNKILHMLEQRLKSDDTIVKKEITEEELEKRIEELEMKKEFEVAVGKWDCLKRHLDDEIAKYEEQQKSDDELTSLKAQKRLIPLYEQRKTEEEFHWLLDNYQYLDAVKAITQHGKFEKKGVEWVVKLNQDKVFMQSEEYENKKSLATALKIIFCPLTSFVILPFILGSFGGEGGDIVMGIILTFLGGPILLPLNALIGFGLVPWVIDSAVYGDKMTEEQKDKDSDLAIGATVTGLIGGIGTYAGGKKGKRK